MRLTEDVCDRCSTAIRNTNSAQAENQCGQAGIDRKKYAIGNKTLQADLCRECENAVEAKIESLFTDVRSFALEGALKTST